MASILLGLPSEIWADILGWLDLFALAKSVQAVDYRFSEWVDLFLRSRDGASAYFCVGIAYQLGVQNKPIRDKLGRKLIEVSAERGNPCGQAYCNLEGWRDGGQGVPDWKLAYGILKAAAASTSHGKKIQAWAAFLVGYCLYHGYGVSVDQAEAAFWYQSSSAAGLCAAQNHLAIMYLEGEGDLERNKVMARELLLLASRQGNCRARYTLALHDYSMATNSVLGSIINTEIHEEISSERGETIVSLLLQSAHQGHDEAEYRLALLYAIGSEKSGLPLQNDEIKAVKWMTKAAEQASSSTGLAECELAKYHEKGLGLLQPSKTKALEWYVAAARKENPEGLFNLGSYFLYGFGGLEANPAQAAACFQRAAAQGYELAAAYLDVLMELGIMPPSEWED